MRFSILIAACCTLPYALLPGPAAAVAPAAAPTPERPPLWEYGVITTVATLPDYPGADRNQLRVLPLPYAVYRGKTLRADGGGVRGRYRFTADTELDLSFGGALPVGRGNPVREGMPKLDLLLEIGPRLTLVFARPSVGAAWSLALPVRAVFSTDFTQIASRGVVTTPELIYSNQRLADSDWRGRLAIGPVFASGALADYFYRVGPEFVRADRPAYEARGGYLESRLTLAFSRAFSDALTLFAFGRASALQGATNADSPLLRQQLNWATGVGLAWTFRRSAETVDFED